MSSSSPPRSVSRLIRASDPAAAVVPWRAPEVASPTGSGSFRRGNNIDANAVQQRAWQQGFDHGHAAGVEAGTHELQARIEAVERILDALARPLEDLDHRVEEELLALVQAVVRQLVRRELHHDPGHLIGLIREGLAALPLSSGEVVVRLNPADADAIRERLPESASDCAWRLENDPLLERGGCLISTLRSDIDSRLDARLARIIAGLLTDQRDGTDQ
ncbi:MAG: flagellar assembly protein FliH [Gammaproteobacteria bacterium]